MLDLLIRLAFERKADREVEQLLNEPDPILTAEQAAVADRAFHSAMDREALRLKNEKRNRRGAAARKTLLRAGKAAACLLIAAAVALPVAIATSAEFRVTLMRMLVRLDEEREVAHITFAEPEESAAEIPAGWKGEWYMTRIPEDLSLVEVNQYLLSTEYSDGASRQLWFDEMEPHDELMIGTKNTDTADVSVNGNPGWMMIDHSEYHAMDLVWTCEGKAFSLRSFNLTQEELLWIAENVRKIP